MGGRRLGRVLDPVLKRLAMRTIMAVLLLASTSGCAWLFHKPRPDLDLPPAERPWRVRCEWVLPPSAEPGAAPGPRGAGWTWASDASSRRLVLDGRVEDGFFSVTGLRAASDEDDRDVVAMPATVRAVSDACAETLARQKPGETLRVHSVTGSRDGEGIAVPLVFPDDPALSRPVSRMVVFGDSLSDTGNLKQRLMVFPSSPYWLGRFANGPNWADYLAERTGVSIHNHAFGGAVAVEHEDVPAADIIASIQEGAQVLLTGSIDRYVQDYVERDLTYGVVQHPREIVHVIWGGANDYISKEPFTGEIGTLLDDPQGEAGYVRIVDEAVAAISGQVRRLYAAGARQFVVVNLPDLGRTPIVLQNTSYVPFVRPERDDTRRLVLARKLGDLTMYHNNRLRLVISRLSADLPCATIIPIDAAQIVDRMLTGQAPDGSRKRFDYGFAVDGMEDELRDGRRRVRQQKRCYSGGYLGTSDPAKVCAQARNAFFWDIVHPTSYTHCWVAFFVQRELARAGLLSAEPSAEEHRAYCTRQAELVY